MNLLMPPVKSKDEMLKMKSFEREAYVRQILRKTLQMNPHGVTLKMMVESLPFDYRTIEKHMFALTFTNEVYTQKIGATTLYLSNLSDVENDAKRSIELNGQEFEICDITNRNGEFILIRQLEGNDTTGGILIPKEKFKKFFDFLSGKIKDR